MTKRKTTRAASKPPAKGKARTPPFEHWPDWSSAKYWGFLRSALRGAFNKYPVKWAVLNKAKRAYGGASKSQKWEYLCAECNKHHKGKDVSVDHIVPCGSLSSYEDIAPFVQRLFVGVDGLQVLCKACHHTKTQEERKNK